MTASRIDAMAAADRGASGGCPPPPVDKVDHNGYCLSHPAIKLQRRTPTGEWKSMLDACPLCTVHNSERRRHSKTRDPSAEGRRRSTIESRPEHFDEDGDGVSPLTCDKTTREKFTLPPPPLCKEMSALSVTSGGDRTETTADSTAPCSVSSSISGGSFLRDAPSTNSNQGPSSANNGLSSSEPRTRTTRSGSTGGLGGLDRLEELSPPSPRRTSSSSHSAPGSTPSGKGGLLSLTGRSSIPPPPLAGPGSRRGSAPSTPQSQRRSVGQNMLEKAKRSLNSPPYSASSASSAGSVLERAKLALVPVPPLTTPGGTLGGQTPAPSNKEDRSWHPRAAAAPDSPSARSRGSFLSRRKPSSSGCNVDSSGHSARSSRSHHHHQPQQPQQQPAKVKTKTSSSHKKKSKRKSVVCGLAYTCPATQRSGSYTGQLNKKTQLPDGIGTLRYDNGDVDEGEWREGQLVNQPSQGEVMRANSWAGSESSGDEMMAMAERRHRRRNSYDSNDEVMEVAERRSRGGEGHGGSSHGGGVFDALVDKMKTKSADNDAGTQASARSKSRGKHRLDELLSTARSKSRNGRDGRRDSGEVEHSISSALATLENRGKSRAKSRGRGRDEDNATDTATVATMSSRATRERQGSVEKHSYTSVLESVKRDRQGSSDNVLMSPLGMASPGSDDAQSWCLPCGDGAPSLPPNRQANSIGNPSSQHLRTPPPPRQQKKQEHHVQGHPSRANNSIGNPSSQHLRHPPPPPHPQGSPEEHGLALICAPCSPAPQEHKYSPQDNGYGRWSSHNGQRGPPPPSSGHYDHPNGPNHRVEVQLPPHFEHQALALYPNDGPDTESDDNSLGTAGTSGERSQYSKRSNYSRSSRYTASSRRSSGTSRRVSAGPYTARESKGALPPARHLERTCSDGYGPRPTMDNQGRYDGGVGYDPRKNRSFMEPNGNGRGGRHDNNVGYDPRKNKSFMERR